MKHTIPGYITAKPAESWEKGEPNIWNGLAIRFSHYPPTDTGGYALICEHEMSFEIPDDFDPRPQQIASLKAKKTELERKFSEAVMQINRQISQLQAIEYEAA